MQFRILGPLEVMSGDRALSLGVQTAGRARPAAAAAEPGGGHQRAAGGSLAGREPSDDGQEDRAERGLRTAYDPVGAPHPGRAAGCGGARTDHPGTRVRAPGRSRPARHDALRRQGHGGPGEAGGRGAGRRRRTAARGAGGVARARAVGPDGTGPRLARGGGPAAAAAGRDGVPLRGRTRLRAAPHGARGGSTRSRRRSRCASG